MGVREPHARNLSIERARELRRMSSEPERKLWAILYALRQRGYHFRRQHPVGPYYTDFACVRARLVIEADGITHSSDEDRTRDARRTAELARHGFRVLRFWNNDIMADPDVVYREIERALDTVPELTPTPVPSPSEGGGRPRLRKLRTGLKELTARTGDAVGSPSPAGGEDTGGGPRAPKVGEQP